jgi:spore coat protein U-like protein
MARPMRPPCPAPSSDARRLRPLALAFASLAATILSAGLAGAAEAATLTGNAAIAATIVKVCTLGTGSVLAFGDLEGSKTLASDTDVTADLTVGCSDGASFTVYLGDGLARLGGGNRQLQNGTARLAYQIYQDTDHTIIWDETGGPTAEGGTGGLSLTGTGANAAVPVYGRIAAGTVIPGTTGQFTDTVLVTVAY